jgi:hypothetical protein
MALITSARPGIARPAMTVPGLLVAPSPPPVVIRAATSAAGVLTTATGP